MMTIRKALPKCDCEYGYPVYQLEAILGDRLEEFMEWHWGKTYVECDGTKWFKEFRKNGECCGGQAHGDVYYYSDVRKFLG